MPTTTIIFPFLELLRQNVGLVVKINPVPIAGLVLRLVIVIENEPVIMIVGIHKRSGGENQN